MQCDALDIALDRLGVDRAHGREMIRAALAGAAADFALYRAHSARSPDILRASNLMKLATAAADGDAGAADRLRKEVGDGTELDGLIDRLMNGRPLRPDEEPASLNGRMFARQTSHPAGAARSLALHLHDTLRFATPTTPSRRALKFFQVLALGFVFVRLTKQRPGYRTEDRGAKQGAFVDFVINTDVVFPLDGGSVGLEKSCAEVARTCRSEFQGVLDFGLEPARYGSPNFLECGPFLRVEVD